MKKCEFHNFTTIGEDSNSASQVCKKCGEKKVYKKINGQINNAQYLKDHAKDFAQPTGATAKVFKRFYGEKYKEFLKD